MTLLEQSILVNEKRDYIANGIRCLFVHELDKTRSCFYNFFNESELSGKPNWNHWKKTWEDMIEKEIGYLVAYLREGEVIGVIGGLCFPCMLTGQLEMTEAFWYVEKPYRGGPTGLKLLRYFESLSKALEAVRIKMIHMTHLNPETMKDIYHRLGYRQVEVGYIKEIEK